ncbi:unnamed protein product [Allacma fusca]|uniref:T-complex-associated testis-expressed protein 1 n=1 Tax=Allacma fusca TaxID=39272 RepID=A0A8J2LSA9_9HEXA|nr:unnamed protein product [Allacma fusca]
MKIPHTIPKIILRAYARELTPEQLKEQYEGRMIRSEDPTWDEDQQQTLAEMCLSLVIEDYPFYVRLIDETNNEGQKKYEAGLAQWQENVVNFKKRRQSFERKMLALEFKKGRRGRSMSGVDDDDDDDDNDDTSAKVILAPEEVPDSFEDFLPRKPVLDQLNDTDRIEVIEELDVKKIPLPIAISTIPDATIPDAYYWERAALDKWPWVDHDEHGKSWKQTYMEKHLWEGLESFHPFEGDLPELMKNVELVAPFIKQLTLINLIPNCFGVESRPKIFKPFIPDEELTGEDEGFAAAAELKKLAAEALKNIHAEDEPQYEETEKQIRDNSHLDLSLIMPHLKFLKKFCIIYEMQEMGMDWEARYFDFTDKDVENLAKALTLAPSIEHFELNRSRMTDEQCKILVKDGLLKMPHLKVLNISYNNIGNAGARAIAKLIIEPRPNGTIHTLSMARNNIKNKGAKAIAYALTLNTHLTFLDIRLNYVGNPGGKDFGHALVKNTSLQYLNLAANRLTDDTCYVLGKMLQHNKTLKELDVSSNNMGRKGGEYLAMGVRNNKVILKVDIRLADTGLDFEYDLDSHLKKNRSKLPYSLLDRDDIYPPENESFTEQELMGKEDEGEFDFDEEEDEEEEEDEIRTLLPPSLKLDRETSQRDIDGTKKLPTTTT